MARGNNISEKLADIIASKQKINAKLVNLGVALPTDDLADMAKKVEENIPNQGAIKATVTEGKTYTIPQGYHNGSGTVTGLSDTEGDAQKYKLQSKEATPRKSQINVTSDAGYYGLSSVTVNAIPYEYQDVTRVTALAEDVLVGRVYVYKDGTVVTGTMANNGAVVQTLSETKTSYTIPKGYHNGNGVISILVEEKSVTPTKSVQSIVPTNGKVLSKVTVNAIPNTYQDVSGVNATADTVLEDYDFVNSLGETVSGAMKNNGSINAEFTGLTEEQSVYRIPKGYHNGEGTVSLTSDISDAVAQQSSLIDEIISTLESKIEK